MAELREVFVRARFAEEKVFERADIEEWLEQQRSAERPLDSTGNEIHPAWEHFPPRERHKSRGYGLTDFATPTIPQGQLDNDPFYDIEKYGKASLALRKFNMPLFLGRSMAILQTDPTWQDLWATAFAIDWNGKSICLTEADADPDKFTLAVREVLFAEWTYHRPRWEKAREIICASAEARLLEQRVKAEADFNSAVAVSVDGTQIVCADRVIVVVRNPNNKSRRLLSFSAVAFNRNKILRVAEIQHDNVLFRNISRLYSNIINVPAFFMSDVPQTLFSTNHESKPRFFVTEEKFCPSPLPEGGVELK